MTNKGKTPAGTGAGGTAETTSTVSTSNDTLHQHRLSSTLDEIRARQRENHNLAQRYFALAKKAYVERRVVDADRFMQMGRSCGRAAASDGTTLLILEALGVGR